MWRSLDKNIRFEFTMSGYLCTILRPVKAISRIIHTAQKLILYLDYPSSCSSSSNIVSRPGRGSIL